MSDKPAINQLQRRELLRVTILLEAYERQPSELTFDYLIPKLRNFRGHPTTDSEIDAAIQYLLDKSYLAMRFHECGATRYYRITATGVDLMERQHANLIDQS
jgi:hypothetical protein